MRRILQLATVVILLASACTEGTTDTTEITTAVTTTSTSTEPTATSFDPGLIVIAEGAGEIGDQFSGLGPFTMNPFLTTEWRLSTTLDPVLFAGAWQPDQNGNPAPDLLTALPHPDDGTAVLEGDALVLTYEIREDASWSDGEPVTAEDFLVTLAILQDPALGIQQGWRDDHTGVTAQGTDKTLTVRIPAPHLRYRYLFPVVVPAHAIDLATFGDDWNETIWPSAGPFVLSSFERFAAPLSGRIELQRHPNDPAPEGYPNTVRIDFYQRDDHGDSLAVDAFIAGQADVLSPNVLASHEFGAIEDQPVLVRRSEAFIWEVLFIQPGPQRLALNPESVMDERTMRAIVSSSLDRVALDESQPAPSGTHGGAITSLTEFYLGVPSDGWTGEEGGPPPPGTPLAFRTTAGALTTVIGERVVAMLEDVGFSVIAEFDGDSSSVFADFADGDFEVTAVRLVRLPGIRGLLGLFDLVAPDSDDFPDLWQDRAAAETFLDILDEIRNAIDPDDQVQLLEEAERLLVEEMFMIPVVKRGWLTWAYWPDRVTGPTDADGLEGFLANLTEWRRP